VRRHLILVVRQMINTRLTQANTSSRFSSQMIGILFAPLWLFTLPICAAFIGALNSFTHFSLQGIISDMLFSVWALGMFVLFLIIFLPFKLIFLLLPPIIAGFIHSFICNYVLKQFPLLSSNYYLGIIIGGIVGALVLVPASLFVLLSVPAKDNSIATGATMVMNSNAVIVIALVGIIFGAFVSSATLKRLQ
jgi:hypothetical protein